VTAQLDFFDNDLQPFVTKVQLARLVFPRRHSFRHSHESPAYLGRTFAPLRLGQRIDISRASELQAVMMINIHQ